MAETIDQKEANKALYIAGAVIVLLVIGLFTNGFGLLNGNDNPNNGGNGGTFVKLEIGNAPVLGDVNAPVTLYEFSDFSCPFCAATVNENPLVIASLRKEDPSWEAPLPQLKKEYVETGKVKIVFKYYPGHGSGTAAHLVGGCINDQDPKLFWRFHDRAFAQQENVGNIETMKSLAQELGADKTLLDECIIGAKYVSQLQKDQAMGSSNGVRATPTFVLNGKVLEGAISYPKLKAAIDKELAKN